MMTAVVTTVIVDCCCEVEVSDSTETLTLQQQSTVTTTAVITAWRNTVTYLSLALNGGRDIHGSFRSHANTRAFFLTPPSAGIHTTPCPQVPFATISTVDSRKQYLETRCSVNVQQRKA